MKKFTLDRIEGARAVLECENGECVSLDITSLPQNIKEGDVLVFEEGSYFLDKLETERRKEKIKNMMSALFE
ncbi:MAG: DUF3006 domain-containing protein [Clostridiales bacterium]|nr:DUF3006 domain-containing protein [Clostridiales bacterium]